MTHNIMRASDALTDKIEGPFAIVRGCRLCNHRISRRPGRGRGAGLREGNKQRGEMHCHIRDTHPKALTETVALLAADGWQSIPPWLPINKLKDSDR